MTTAVNFLPWREARRRQRLRIVLLYAVGFLLILLTIAQVKRAERHAVEALTAVRAAAENQLWSALRQRESMMLERQQQGQRLRLRQQKRGINRGLAVPVMGNRRAATGAGLVNPAGVSPRYLDVERSGAES